MRRRLALWGALVLLLVAIMPVATADAASRGETSMTPATSGYTYRVLSNYCYGTHGDSVYFKVKETAQGWTPANYLTINSSAQYRNVGSSTWHTAFIWNQVHYGFIPNGQNHWLSLWRGYVGNDVRYFRIVMTLRVWDGNSLLAFKTLHSVQC